MNLSPAQIEKLANKANKKFIDTANSPGANSLAADWGNSTREHTSPLIYDTATKSYFSPLMHKENYKIRTPLHISKDSVRNTPHPSPLISETEIYYGPEGTRRHLKQKKKGGKKIDKKSIVSDDKKSIVSDPIVIINSILAMSQEDRSEKRSALNNKVKPTEVEKAWLFVNGLTKEELLESSPALIKKINDILNKPKKLPENILLQERKKSVLNWLKKEAKAHPEKKDSYKNIMYNLTRKRKKGETLLDYVVWNFKDTQEIIDAIDIFGTNWIKEVSEDYYRGKKDKLSNDISNQILAAKNAAYTEKAALPDNENRLAREAEIDTKYSKQIFDLETQKKNADTDALAKVEKYKNKEYKQPPDLTKEFSEEEV